jgi:hypothetical protein
MYPCKENNLAPAPGSLRDLQSFSICHILPSRILNAAITTLRHSTNSQRKKEAQHAEKAWTPVKAETVDKRNQNWQAVAQRQVNAPALRQCMVNVLSDIGAASVVYRVTIYFC